MNEITDDLPGADLINRGLQDLSKGDLSSSALLVLIGAPRLRRLGISISSQNNRLLCPEHALYSHLQAKNARSAHSRYNSLIRRLVSFERAMERRRKREEPFG